MRKILIVGHTGLLGRHLFTLLQQNNHVIGCSLSNGFDITSANSFSVLERDFDLVINCSGAVYSDLNFVNSVKVNTEGSLNIAGFASEISARFIQVSSIFAIFHPENEYFDGYGAIKKSTEDLLINFSKIKNLNITILRLPQLFDDEAVAKKSQPMLYRIIKQVACNKKVLIHGEKNPKRNYLHVKDASGLIDSVISTPIIGIYNCPNNNSFTVISLTELIGKALNKEPSIAILPFEIALKSTYIPDSELIWNKIAYKPKYLLSSSIKNIIRCI